LGNDPLVALAGRGGLILRTSADRLAQAADMARVIHDTKSLMDYGGDPAAGPELSSKAIGFGAMPKQVGQLAELLAR
jgi:hypothetical protein